MLIPFLLILIIVVAKCALGYLYFYFNMSFIILIILFLLMSGTSWLLNSFPHKEWHITIRSESCPDLNGEDPLRTLDCVYWIVLRFKLVYWLQLVNRFELVYRYELLYSFEVVYRVVTKLSLHDGTISLVTVLLSLPCFTLFCLKVKCYIDYCWCLAQCWIFHMFLQRTQTQANMSTGPDLRMINKHWKFSKWNQFILESSWQDRSSATWVTSSYTN
jgi:hypothetical protein